MAEHVSAHLPSRAENEVVDLVSQLIRFDTSNTGDPATTRGERAVPSGSRRNSRKWATKPNTSSPGNPAGGNVFARLAGGGP